MPRKRFDRLRLHNSSKNERFLTFNMIMTNGFVTELMAVLGSLKKANILNDQYFILLKLFHLNIDTHF